MSKITFLSFEQPIAELESKIEELRFVQEDSAVDISEEIDRLSQKSQQLTKDIYAKLTPWQVSQIARHPQRPYTMDYVNEIFTDFHELHGDRSYADDLSIVGGLARFNGQSCMVIGHQKGRDTKERAMRNFGMPKPEGYRKAMRLMKLAEKFNIPVFTFVDTPGAFPGIDAEERGQSEAIGHNLYVMAELKVPLIATIIGEGGSGGALAIAVGNVVMMLQYSTYSVISPEGCASILWRSADKASEAAAALAITADRLKEFGLIDRVVNEPIGGAHRDPRRRVVRALIQRQGGGHLARRDGRQPSRALRVRSQRIDRRDADQSALQQRRGDERASGRLEHEAERPPTHARAAVGFRDRCAGEAERCDLLPECRVEGASGVAVGTQRLHRCPLRKEFAGAVLEQTLVVGEGACHVRWDPAGPARAWPLH